MIPAEILAWINREIASIKMEQKDPHQEDRDFFRLQGKLDVLTELLEAI